MACGYVMKCLSAGPELLTEDDRCLRAAQECQGEEQRVELRQLGSRDLGGKK